jgi:RHS repeat-associated protein
VSDSGTSGLPSVTLTYGYDAYDNRTSISDSLGGSIVLGYDNGFNLTSLAWGMGDTHAGNVSLGYDSLDRLTSLSRTIPNNFFAHTLTTSISYDKDSNVTGITHTDARTSTTLANYTYSYDAVNQVSGYTGPEGSLTYTYDRSGQLTAVGGARNESYSYDVNGNRTMTGYSTGTGNELQSDGTYSYTYDNEGNVLTQTRISDGQVTDYTWDYENRLTEVLVKTSGGTVLQDDKFTYDAWGRRIGKSTLSGGQTWTLYDGDNTYADFNSSGTLTYRYLYGNGIDQLLARFDGTNTAWYLTDRLGSVRQLVSSGGSVLDQLTYDSYGNILSESSPSNGDRFKYTGREWDSEIALQYNRARYYDPKAGRWFQDPLGLMAGDPDLYRYIMNKPPGATDPTGAFMAPPPSPPPAPPPDGTSKPVGMLPHFPYGPVGGISVGVQSPQQTGKPMLFIQKGFNVNMNAFQRNLTLILAGAGLAGTISIGSIAQGPATGCHFEGGSVDLSIPGIPMLYPQLLSGPGGGTVGVILVPIKFDIVITVTVGIGVPNK